MDAAGNAIDERPAYPQPLVIVADTDNSFCFQKGGAVGKKTDNELVVGLDWHSLGNLQQQTAFGLVGDGALPRPCFGGGGGAKGGADIGFPPVILSGFQFNVNAFRTLAVDGRCIMFMTQRCDGKRLSSPAFSAENRNRIVLSDEIFLSLITVHGYVTPRPRQEPEGV